MSDKLDVKKVDGLWQAARNLATRNDALNAKLAKVKEEGLALGMSVLATAEVVGAAFTMGFLRGYYGEKASILGVPIDAATGLLLHGVAYGLGFAGGRTAKFVSENFHNLANGALATWAAASGAQLGMKKASAAQDAGSQALPAPPAPPKQLVAGEASVGAAAPQLPAANPWAAWMAQQQGNPWGMPQPQGNQWGMPQPQGNQWGMPQSQANPMTQEELAAAMAWQQAAA